jgi:hypothetical protein
MKNLLLALLALSPALFSRPHPAPPVPLVQITNENCLDLFVGVDNPLVVLYDGQEIASEYIQVTNGTLQKQSGIGKFTLKPTAPGEVLITVNPPGGVQQSRSFVARSIPVKALLGAQYDDGAFLSNGAFKAQSGVAAVINCCGFDAKCAEMESMSILRMPKNGPIERATNTPKNSRFDEVAKALIQKAMPRDTYLFFNLSARCPGDKYPRQLRSFTIYISE